MTSRWIDSTRRRSKMPRRRRAQALVVRALICDALLELSPGLEDPGTVIMEMMQGFGERLERIPKEEQMARYSE
jgi:hypothetical protein